MSQTKPKAGLASLIARPLLAGAIAAGAAAPGSALADVFLDLDGIPGDSTDAQHKNQIDILTYTQSFKNTAAPSSTGTGGGAGKVTCGDITVMKNIDKSSPLLIKAVTTGQHIKTGVLTFRTVGAHEINYYVVSLKDVVITEIDQTDQSSSARIFEKVTFSATDFAFKFTPFMATGKAGTPISFEFNCAANKAG
jgi:type VI secretion system secreted protein Hcp